MKGTISKAPITKNQKWWGLFFVFPAVLFFAVFAIFPILFGSYLSLTRYNLLSPPVYVGFGISSAEQAATASRQADGVIIGSRLMSLAGDGDAAGAGRRVGAFLAGARRAIDAG